MESDLTLARIRRDVRVLKLYAAGTTLLVLVLLLTALSPDRTARFTELEVERLDIVEPDGSLSMALASRERMPGGIFEGVELIDHRQGVAGIIFYNAKGDEVGGLTFEGAWTDSAYRAGGHLSFDQFQQDQVVTVTYADDGRDRWAGFGVYDRPTDYTIADFVGALKSAREAVGPARDTAAERFRAMSQRMEIRRLMAGTRNGTTALRLSDPAGRERIRIYVDSAGAAGLEFLDEAGRSVLRLPD